MEKKRKGKSGENRIVVYEEEEEREFTNIFVVILEQIIKLFFLNQINK